MRHILLINTTVNKMISAFSWMLIHSLWQGLLLAVIAGAVLIFTKRSVATYRYNLVLVLFMAFIGVCAYTFFVEWNSAGLNAAAPPDSGGTGTDVSPLLGIIYQLKQLLKIFPDYFSANAPMVVLIWSIFFLFKSVKMIACLVYNHRVKNVQVCEVDQFWAETVSKFSEKIGIKKTVKLLQSGYIKVPVVLGHLKPVILIPVGLLAGLPSEQVEAILLHELAHIRRNDYFINFLQNVAETVFFFNPGLLWISSLLREERENCADDIALAQTQNKKSFVQALISFREHELYGTGYATAFPGKKNYLLRRVSRIIGNENRTFGIGEKVFVTGSVFLLAFAIGIVAFGQIRVRPDRPMIKAKYISARDSIATDSILANQDALKIIAPLRDKRARHKAKMQDGIVGIQGQKARVTYSGIIKPVEPVLISTKKHQGLTAKERSHPGQKRSEIQQSLTMKELGALDQKQAVEQALIPKQQVGRDQEQARKDQAQALRDQIAAKKEEKQDVDNQEQKNKTNRQEPASQQELNQLQVAKNKLQVDRNIQQARLNEFQARKNRLQDIKNEEQARLNDIQAKRNEQQALKNKASVQ